MRADHEGKNMTITLNYGDDTEEARAAQETPCLRGDLHATWGK